MIFHSYASCIYPSLAAGCIHRQPDVIGRVSSLYPVSVKPQLLYMAMKSRLEALRQDSGV